ncbi:MAG: EamA family transporter, partial [Sporomusaceae bacterium]|nr:EamA family transporter [Sporomusaceae bacterium]
MYIVYSAMCLIFGTTFLAIKVGVNVGAPPFLFAGARFFTAGLIVLLAVKLCGRSITLPKGHYKSIFIVGLFMTALMFGCLYWGEQYISSSLAALLAATTPLMIGLVEWFQGVKEYSLIRGSGLLISFLGVSIALLPALMLEATPYAFLAVIVILLAEV